ncbi:hypothetical protein RNJ44_04500 [Nakaseomyces bracarensis]|uniref:phosphoinositide 5-phosphatase n=1 Tax=Nakaseomyces bracarensis TaxID=273131 RepID=A0ABR4NV27_9SACH
MIILVSNKPERKLAIASHSNALIFKSLVSADQKLKCSVEMVPKKDCIKQSFEKLSNLDIFAFIGIIEIEGYLFLGTITGKREVAQPIPDTSINKILAVDFFCLNSDKWDGHDIDDNGYVVEDNNSKSPKKTNDELRHPCWALMKLLSNGTFYFSNEFDLTSTLQTRGFYNSTMNENIYDEQYMWNNFMILQLVGYRDKLDNDTKKVFDKEGFLTTIVRGFSKTGITYVGDFKVAMTIISRESFKRNGYRNSIRGINDEGETADFMETEFIMYSRSFSYAHAQVRGSVPVFWEQKEYSTSSPKIHITRALEATQSVFEKHMNSILNTYGYVRILNLLSQSPEEQELSGRFGQHLEQLPESCQVIDYDIKKEFEKGGEIATKSLIPMVLKYIQEDGYYSFSVTKHRTLSEQQGIFRTNCVDCLGRSNLAQQIISIVAFRTFLEDSRIIKCSDYIEDKEFYIMHNKLWEENGQEIARIHTRNPSDNNILQKKSKLSLSGRLSSVKNSVSRKYFNPFTEKDELIAIDDLLGRGEKQYVVEIFDNLSDNISNSLEKLSGEYMSYQHLTLFIGSYNASGKVIDDDLTTWLFPIGEKFKADIIVVGLQEVIEMSARSILNADDSKGSEWEETIRTYLGFYGDKYLLLRIEHMTSLTLLVFVRESKVNLVRNVEGTNKRTGFGGMAANKGAVATRLKIGESSFCFVNCHLAAGDGNVEDRKNDYTSIKDGIKFPGGKGLLDNDFIFWFGDMNYRVTLPNDEVRTSLFEKKEGYIEDLLNHDQLTQEICSGTVFGGFKEPPIKFRPTYKYDVGTDLYDTSEKARTPSWTDRILYKGDDIQVLSYSDVDLLYSDHKPIYAAYRFKVPVVDTVKRQMIKEKLLRKFTSEVNNNQKLDSGSVSRKSSNASNYTLIDGSISSKIEISELSRSGSFQRRPPPKETNSNSSSPVDFMLSKKPSMKRPPPPNTDI